MGSGADGHRYDVEYPPLDAIQSTTLPPYPCNCTADVKCKKADGVKRTCTKAVGNLERHID